MRGAPGPSAQPCVRCRAPAVYHNHRTGDDFCQPCGIYVAGQHHAAATIARQQLCDAIAALLATELNRQHIEAMTNGQLEGVHRPTGPDIAHPNDPRPWIHYLFDPIP